MKDIFIINITRMGDLIQMTPVIAGLREKYPGVRIHLLASKNFVEICKHIPPVDRLFVITIQDVLKMLKNARIVDCYKYLKGLIEQVNDRTYDMVINFTHSLSSAVISSLINAREIRGITMDAEGHSYKKHPWIKYLFNVIPCRNYNPFHLCDMHIGATDIAVNKEGLHLIVTEDMENWAESVLYNEGVRKGDLVIGFQIGASAEDKRWNISNFSRLADKLSESLNAWILLTGSRGEVASGKELEALSNARIINYIGKTDLQELSALIKRCTLFVSNDSGPLHIATAVGTRALNISLASVHFRETGPYGEGHYVIKADIPCSPCNFFSGCTNTICKEIINAENVYELIKKILNEKGPDCIEDSPLWKNVQVYISFFDDDGLIEFKPLIRRPISKSAIFTHIYRYTWLKILGMEGSRDTTSIIEKIQERLNRWYIFDKDSLDFLIEEEEALLRIKAIAEIGISKMMEILKEARRDRPDIGWIKEVCKDLSDIDQELEKIGYTHPALLPLSRFFQYGKEGLEGDDLTYVAEGTYKLYMELKEHASMIYGLILKIKEMQFQAAIPGEVYSP